MRKTTRWTLGTLAALALASGAAWAAHHEDDEAKGKSPHAGFHGKYFEKRDTDGDGAISRAEWMAASEERFKKADADGNGSVTRDEMKAAHQRMRGDRHGKMKGGEGGTE